MAKYPYISENKCKNCSGEILIKRSRDISNIFCSTSCVGKIKRKEIKTTNCNFCNNEFLMSSKSKNLFCSIECSNRNKIKKYDRVCERCGVTFIVNNIAEINRGGNRFCSGSCGTRKYSFDDEYFNFIDNQNKAYFLGFIYADGCLSKKNELILKLHNKDKQLLDEFKKDIKSEHPIKDIYVKNRQDIDFQCRFSISSKKMANQLNKLGIMPAKTFKIDFPILDSNLIRHFIRGYFDGDGCIHNIKNSKSSSITIFSASENFKDYLVEYFINVIGFKITTYKKVGGYALCFYKKEFIEKFYKFLYDDANIYLERKRIKFPNILE